MKNIFVLALAISVLTFCQPQKDKEAEGSKSNQYKNAKIEIKTFSVKTGGYGYDVYADTTLLIHQPHIPGMSGVIGFEKEEQAQRVAMLVVEKIQNGIMPPTITGEELQKSLAE